MREISRRQFISAAALAAGSAWLSFPESLLAAGSPYDDRFGGFKVGIQSNILRTISPELGTTIQHMADLGVHLAEFLGRHYEVTVEDERISEVASMLARHRIGMESFFAGNIVSEDEQELRKLFEFAKKTGVSILVGQPAVHTFPVLDDLVQEYEIKIAIHNYGPEGQFDRTEDTLKAAAPWNWRIGYCLDTGHCMRSGEDPVEAVRRMGGRLYGMHLRDHASIAREQPPETILGEGALDLPALCQALRDVHFEGPLALEIYYATDNPLPSIRQSLSNLAAAARVKG